MSFHGWKWKRELETRAALQAQLGPAHTLAQGRGWFFTVSSPDVQGDAIHWPWQHQHKPGSVVTWHGAVYILAVQGYHPAKQRRPYPSCLLGMSSLCQFPDGVKMQLARAGWPGQSCALLGTPEQFLRRTIPFEWWEKVLDSNLFAGRAGAQWAPGDLWDCLMLQRRGGSWMEALECPWCQWCARRAQCWLCCPPCSSSTGEMAGGSVSLGTPTACFLSSSRQDVGCHGRSSAHKAMLLISISASFSLRLSLLRPSS